MPEHDEPCLVADEPSIQEALPWAISAINEPQEIDQQLVAAAYIGQQLLLGGLLCLHQPAGS